MASHTLRSILAISLLLGACAAEDSRDPDDEFGMDGPVEPTPPPGKEDSQNRRGLLVNTDTTRTQVWSARNKWEDTDTPAARKAGLAWGESSGLNWDEKYQAWIASMERQPGVSYYDTFTLTTPWGKTLPAPKLECAEASIFLRITFSAWYELPFFMEAIDGTGTRVFFGHNGVRTASGRYKNTPEYAVRYRDYTNLSSAQYTSAWPKDDGLRGRALYGGTDDQSMLREGATFGEYVDEIHLNKRVGHFTMLALGYLGSVNLADAANTYNIVPDAVAPGDTLLERWQRRGIGHTLVVKQVTPIGEGNLDVTLVSGSMPRRQPKWESGVASKNYFTDERTGGEGANYDGEEYAKLGGGIKRWRVTKNVDGYWTNTWMNGDEAHWINSTDYPRIAARPGQFEQLLGQVSPQQQRDALLEIISDRRSHLSNYPASCSAREARETAFSDLYDLGERDLGMTRAQIDAQYRTLGDYVFAALEYTQSKTCCWNSTTSAMHQIVLDYAQAEQAAAEAEGTCVAPTVFKNRADGYELWRAYAEQTGRGHLWVAWTEDESCPQRDVAEDTLGVNEGTAFCSLPSNDGGGTPDPEPEPETCTDSYEPNDSTGAAASLTAGTYSLRVCDGDHDYFAIAAGGTVTITFVHADGDLDLEALDASGNRLGISQGTSNSETLDVPAGAIVHVFGYSNATGAYTLTVN